MKAGARSLKRQNVRPWVGLMFSIQGWRPRDSEGPVTFLKPLALGGGTEPSVDVDSRGKERGNDY